MDAIQQNTAIHCQLNGGNNKITDIKTTLDICSSGPAESAASSYSKETDAEMSAALKSSGKNEPNYRRKNTAMPEKTFTMQPLQAPGQQSEGPKTSPRKVPPTLKDARKLFVGGLPPDSKCTCLYYVVCPM